jgi:hypothetical protein
MAVLRLARYPVSREVYDAVAAAMHLHTQHPLGLIMHGASEVDGQLQVAQVWDSPEYSRRFEEEILRPALNANGVTAHGEIEMIELHDLVTP